MSLENDDNTLTQFLTPEERVEISRIRQNPSVVGFALIGFDGAELESSGIFNEVAGPIFANIYDISDRIGEELGMLDPCPMVFMESADLEIAGITMSAVRAVIIKRKNVQASVKGLRSVS